MTDILSAISGNTSSYDPFSQVDNATANLNAAISTNNPDAVRLALQQNFNDVLANFLTDEDEEENKNTDYFSFLKTSSSSQTDNLTETIAAAQNGTLTPAQYTALAAQGINIEKLF